MKRKPNTKEGTGNVSRDKTFLKALLSNVGVGCWPLDCYNTVVIADGICFSITTRTDGCNHYFLLEVYDEKDDTAEHDR